MNMKATTLTESDGDVDQLAGTLPDNEELVVVETPPTNKEPEQDARPNASGGEEDAEDERAIAEGRTDAEREAIRERRRKEKQERKERREEAMRRDKLELDFLRRRNEELERRFTNVEQHIHRNELGKVDEQLRAAVTEVEMAEKVIAKAVAAGNGEDVAQAMRYRDQAIAKAQQLNALKQQAAQRPASPPPAAPQMDEVVLDHAKRFLHDHPWYDLKGGDEDSAIVLAIDQSLAKEGYAANSEEYWAELRKRVARRLPERAKREEPNAPPESRREPRGGPAIGSGREHAPTSTRREVYISPERKQALIDAGVWDDPVLRAKYVKRYAEYDRSNRA